MRLSPPQLFLVVICWLIVIPLATCWLWRVVFARSVAHAAALLSDRLVSSSLVMTDCLYGAHIPRPAAGARVEAPRKRSLVSHLQLRRRGFCHTFLLSETRHSI